MAAAAGFSAAGLSVLLPYRPLFVGAAVIALWSGFRQLDKDEQACEAGKPCADSVTRRRMHRVMAAAFVLFFVFGTAPTWIRWIL